MLVSHIVSLYTKRNIIPTTLQSIMEQDGGFERELILMDDNSKDDTVEVAKQVTANFPHVQIKTHTDNKGPSVRLNMGAAIAKGEYLHFLDHDDILPANAIKVMYDLLQKTGAELVYGKWDITGKTPQELLGTRTNEEPNYAVSDKPLDVILDGKYKRMCLLVKKELFDKAGGFDTQVFIQDESLPLRLANAAKRIVVTDAFVNLVPKGEGNLSNDKTQLNHDRFMAYYNFYKINKDLRVYRRAVSAAWKQRRQMGNKYLPGVYLNWIFINYVISRCSTKGNQKLLDKFYNFFQQFKVLKP